MLFNISLYDDADRSVLLASSNMELSASSLLSRISLVLPPIVRALSAASHTAHLCDPRLPALAGYENFVCSQTGAAFGF